MRTHVKQIVCVDDNQLILQILEWHLESRGYTVFPCSSGKQALDLIIRQPIDAVIVDYHMPEMNGNEVAAAIRSIAPRMPIAMFSGESEIPPTARSFIDRFIEKGQPGDFTAVAEFIESVSAKTNHRKVRIGAKQKHSVRHYSKQRHERQAAA